MKCTSTTSSSSASVHGTIRLASLQTVTQVFQQFPVHDRVELWLFLNILSSAGENLGILSDFGRVVTHPTCNFIQLFELIVLKSVCGLDTSAFVHLQLSILH